MDTRFFVTSFLLFTLGFICSSDSNLLRWKLRLLILVPSLGAVNSPSPFFELLALFVLPVVLSQPSGVFTPRTSRECCVKDLRGLPYRPGKPSRLYALPCEYQPPWLPWGSRLSPLLTRRPASSASPSLCRAAWTARACICSLFSEDRPTVPSGQCLKTAISFFIFWFSSCLWKLDSLNGSSSSISGTRSHS